MDLSSTQNTIHFVYFVKKKIRKIPRNKKNEIMYYKEMSDLKCANSLYS